MKKLKIVSNCRLGLDSIIWATSMKLLNQMKGDGVVQNVHYLTNMKYAVFVIVTDGTGMIKKINFFKEVKEVEENNNG